MSLWLLLTAWVSATPVAAKPDGFASWFDSRVKAESARVLSHEKLDLDGDGRSDHLACFVLPRESGTTAPVVLVGLATGDRFAFSKGGLTPSLLDRCPERPPAVKREGSSRPTLTLTRTGLTGYVDSVSIVLDRTGPLLARYSAGDRYMSVTENLVLQSREYLDQTQVYLGKTEEPEPYESAAIVAASSKAEALEQRSPVEFRAHGPSLPRPTSSRQMRFAGRLPPINGGRAIHRPCRRAARCGCSASCLGPRGRGCGNAGRSRRYNARSACAP